MKKGTLIKGLILPLALGAVFGVAFFFFVSPSFVNFDRESVDSIAYFDSDDKAPNNEIYAKLKFADTSLNIRQNCDYSHMISSASLKHGSLPDKCGIGYYCVLEKDIEGVKNANPVIIHGSDEYHYVYVSSFVCNSENEVFLAQPPIADGIIVYYQKTDGCGLKNEYEALAFREAK